MTTDEIVKALHKYAKNAQENFEVDTMRDFDSAADLIESMQAQLAESQRRADAAVESLKRKCLHERMAVKCIYDIETYLELGSAKYIKKTIDEWRGPQEAGKGETE